MIINNYSCSGGAKSIYALVLLVLLAGHQLSSGQGPPVRLILLHGRLRTARPL